MPSIAEIRQQYPQYQDMSDTDLAGALHQKFYSDMPRDAFDAKVGLSAQPKAEKPLTFANDPMGATADVAKSTGVGVGEGAIGLAGMPGDIRSLYAKGADALGAKLGVSPETMESIKSGAYNAAKSLPVLGGIATGPTSEQLTAQVKEQTGDFYEPKTTAGQYGRTVGSFIPAAAAGPGGIARRVATQAILPGLASEAAGQATAGTEAEPYARTAAALGTGVLTAGQNVPKAAKLGSQDLLKEARAGYKDPAVTSLVINPAGPAKLADDITRAMEAKGARPKTAGPAYDNVDELRGLPNTQVGKSMQAAGLSPGAKVEDLKSVRTALGEVARSGADPLTGKLNTAGNAANVAKNKITNYLDNIPAGDVISGDAAKAGSVLRDATGNYAAAQRAKTVEALLKRAENATGSNNSGQNINNETRKKLRSLLDSEKKSAGFSKDEMAKLEKAVLGTKTGNAARFIGNALAPSGAMLWQNSASAGALGAGAGYFLGSDPATTGTTTAVLAQLLGRSARRVGNASTARNVAKFEDAVVSRSPLAQKQAPITAAQQKQKLSEAQREALVRALLNSQLSQSPANNRMAQ